MAGKRRTDAEIAEVGRIHGDTSRLANDITYAVNPEDDPDETYVDVRAVSPYGAGASFQKNIVGQFRVSWTTRDPNLAREAALVLKRFLKETTP